MTTDPWAAASASTTIANGAQSTVASQSSAQQSPIKSADGITDPFGTTSQVVTSSGAKWDPRAPFDEIANRTVVLVPRSLDPAAKNPFYNGSGKESETREEYRVDLVILDGEPFSFTYKHRPSKDAEPVDATFEVPSFPFVLRQQSIVQGQLIKLLKGIDAAPDKLFAVGVLKRVPQNRDAGSYTIESIEKSRTEYIAYVQKTGKTEPDNRQRHTWGLVDDPQYLTPDRMQLARAWWEKAKATWPELSNES